MNCEEYQKSLSLLIDGEISPDDAEKLQQHLQQCDHCTEVQTTFSQLEDLYRKPNYPFDSSHFVGNVMRKVRPNRSGIYRKVAAAILIITAGIVGATITYFFVSPKHVSHEQPLATLTQYSLKENPWKLLREGISCKMQSPTKAKYLFVEARNRTEDSQVFDAASYQLAVISYYKENKALHALSQLCELAQSIETNANLHSPYVAMGLHLAKEIYLSLPLKDILRPVARQVIQKYKYLSAENNKEQPVIMIGDPYEN
ncbi:anti-sigma factor family protein [Candidatus Uabimicrobium amorphum]|uniref:Putative zinc-finger domain-containing protein n=1 Tax=Uabimicrobium amorphum TaxID=2596890 RepID=A0A5S9F220_UABAM|nr:zf-HC2 domain-containing protein [Candidatus Uabimicrobium amorphum]BBM83018.1 hypothetical protein UABAM_01361 [Candidatus Uabimicrobium amorphum]